MHSSRMRTTRSLTISWGSCVAGGVRDRDVCSRGHAWQGGHALHGACMARTPSPLWTEWQMRVKTL